MKITHRWFPTNQQKSPPSKISHPTLTGRGGGGGDFPLLLKKTFWKILLYICVLFSLNILVWLVKFVSFCHCKACFHGSVSDIIIIIIITFIAIWNCYYQNKYFYSIRHFRPKLVYWNESVCCTPIDRTLKMQFNNRLGSFLRPTIPELWRFL